MDIKQNFDHVDGTFDTEKDELICVKNINRIQVTIKIIKNYIQFFFIYI